MLLENSMLLRLFFFTQALPRQLGVSFTRCTVVFLLAHYLDCCIPMSAPSCNPCSSCRGVQRVPFSRVSRDHTAEFVCPAFSFSREISPFLPNFFSTHLWNTAKFVIMILALWCYYFVWFDKSAESTGIVQSATMRRVATCAQSPVLLSTARVTGPTSQKMWWKMHSRDPP